MIDWILDKLGLQRRPDMVSIDVDFGDIEGEIAAILAERRGDEIHITDVIQQTADIVPFEQSRELATQERRPSVGQPKFVAGFTPYHLLCEQCGSDKLKFRAWVIWSTTFQRWQLDSVYMDDKGIKPTCEDCGSVVGKMQLDEELHVKVAPSINSAYNTPGSELELSNIISKLDPDHQATARKIAGLSNNMFVSYIDKTYHSE